MLLRWGREGGGKEGGGCDRVRQRQVLLMEDSLKAAITAGDAPQIFLSGFLL